MSRENSTTFRLVSENQKLVNAFKAEYHQGSNRNIRMPHYRLRCAESDFAVLCATIHDLGFNCQIYCKEGKRFLVIIADELTQASNNLQERFAAVFLKNKKDLTPKLNVQRVEIEEDNAKLDRLYLMDIDTAHHINVNFMMQKLYHMGALLINSGQCYSGAHYMLPSMTLMSTRRLPNADNAAIKNTVLMQYNNLPTQRGSNGAFKNPLHAAFIICVALDHLPPAGILDIETKLNHISGEITKGQRKPQPFPNGSQFHDATASSAVIGFYIEHNLSRFIDIPEFNPEAYEKYSAVGPLKSALAASVGVSRSNIEYMTDALRPVLCIQRATRHNIIRAHNNYRTYVTDKQKQCLDQLFDGAPRKELAGQVKRFLYYDVTFDDGESTSVVVVDGEVKVSHGASLPTNEANLSRLAHIMMKAYEISHGGLAKIPLPVLDMQDELFQQLAEQSKADLIERRGRLETAAGKLNGLKTKLMSLPGGDNSASNTYNITKVISEVGNLGFLLEQLNTEQIDTLSEEETRAIYKSLQDGGMDESKFNQSIDTCLNGFLASRKEEAAEYLNSVKALYKTRQTEARAAFVLEVPRMMM